MARCAEFLRTSLLKFEHFVTRLDDEATVTLS